MPTRNNTNIRFIPGQSNTLSEGLVQGMQRMRQGQRSGHPQLARQDKRIVKKTFDDSKAGNLIKLGVRPDIARKIKAGEK